MSMGMRSDVELKLLFGLGRCYQASCWFKFITLYHDSQPMRRKALFKLQYGEDETP
jgi:hypothetical protein